MANLKLKRIYDDYSSDDGYRVLVDRLWPRGVSKDKAKIDIWLKEIGPSSQLRKWFNHDSDKFAEFKTRYIKELEDNEAFDELKDITKQHTTVTLIYSAKDEKHNQAQVLREVL